MKVQIKPSEMRWEYFRSGGAGGQHQNKTDSGARVRWFDPVLQQEFVGESREERSQHQNKKLAEEKLIANVKEAYEAEKERQTALKRKDNAVVGFGTDARVRTYNEAKNYIRNEHTGTQFSYKENMNKKSMAEVIEEQTFSLLMNENKNGKVTNQDS